MGRGETGRLRGLGGPVFAAVDCGTSATKAGLFDGAGRTLGIASREVPCLFAPDGSVRQECPRLRDAAFEAVRRVLRRSGIRPGRIASLCITNQRATVVCLDARGDPLGPAVSWQDMTGAGEIARLRRRISDADYYGRTGLSNHAVFTLAKILKIRRGDPDLFRRTSRFALIQDYLLKCFGCGDFLTDHANASLTGLLDVRSLRWSEEILGLAGIPAGRLSSLVPPGRRAGSVSREAARRCGLAEGTPLIAGAGDQQCAGLGAGVVEPGLCSVTLGTAGVVFSHTDGPILDPKRRLACCAHAVAGRWELEGLQNSVGTALRWACGRLTGARDLSPDFVRKVAAVGPGANGVRFFPYLAGAAAPMWRADATGVFAGLQMGHDGACLVRAVLEGVAFENRRILDVLKALRVPIRQIRLTGGYSSMPLWSQIQADVYGRPVVMLANPQATLLGAAMLGAVGCGAAGSPVRAARDMVRTGDTFRPDARAVEQYAAAYATYARSVEALNRSEFFAALRGSR